jgi:hypothetical protein
MNQKPGKTRVQSSAPRYYRATDLMLAAVEYTRKGMPNRAAKALAAAATDRQVVNAMEQLGDQQQDLQDQDFMKQQNQNPDQEQQTARALTRLIKAGQEQMQDDAEDDDMDSDQDDVETAGEMDSDQDDLDLEMDDDDQDPQAEAAVQASVQSRLARAARNREKRAK